jgi:outer membrane receptor for ferrienterochelin and colicins
MKRSLFARSLGTIVFLLEVLTVPTPLAAAQLTATSEHRNNAAISGVVRDGSGGIIPRSTIVIRKDSSALERVIDGQPDGSFSVPALAPGRYVLTVSAAGFAIETRVVDAPQASPLNITLIPAPIVEQVTVVSASRQQELRDTLNTRVDVITRSRIEETGGQETVGEILRELPGVITRRGSETAGAAGEQIQGIDSRQVLVLLDGQPMVGARGIKRGGVLNLDRQSTARLDRIEVVKGAASALYGSEALGGVINLITREPSSPLDTAVALSAGNRGVIGARIDGGFKRDTTYGVFSVERHQHDGFDLTPSTFDTTGAPYRRYDAFAKLQRQFTPSFSLGGVVTGYHNDTAGRSNGELGPQEDDIRDRTLSLNLTSNWMVARNTTLEARGYVSSYSEDSAGRLAPPRSTPLAPGTLDQRFGKIDLTVAHTIGSRQMLQAGAEWSRDRYEGTNRVRDEAGGHEADTTVAWAQHRWSATNRLTTTVGARVDRRSRFETAVSPKIAANIRVTDSLRARASYGRGFRAPDLGQLYYRFLSPSNFYQVIGNPALEPEYANSWQFGGEYAAPQRRARLGVNVFRNDVRDLIESVNLGFVATPAQLAALLAREGLDPSFRPALGRLLFTYRNVFDVVTQGVEVDTDAALTSTVTVGGAYTYLSARDANTDLALTGRHRHHGHVRVSWQPSRTGLRASLRGTFFSSWIATRATVPGGGVQDTIAPRFALWDAFVSQRIGKGLSAFLTIDNLANSQDPNTGVLLPTGAPAAIYRPDVGRTARVGVQWSFSAR